MLEKTLAAVAGLITLAALIFVAVAAAAFALYAVLTPPLGAAGAAAIVAGVCAMLAAIAISVVALSNNKPRKRDDDHDGVADFSFVERLFDMARQRPLLSAGAALAAGLIAIRNPALVATVAAAFLGSKDRR